MWSDISKITTFSNRKTFLSLTIQNKFSITVSSTNKKSFYLDQKIHNITELTKEIKNNTYHRLFPLLQREFKHGRQLNFGPISINKIWISINNKRIAWRDVSRVEVKSGFMIIDTEDEKSLSVNASQIPNIELLFLLMSQE
jgi:hypothetical protein